MEKQIKFQNKEINFKDEGSGNPLILLHGFLGSLEIWKDFSTVLSKKYRVISIDLPGHGKTENFSETHTMDFMAETVKAVLENLKIEKCVMAGHSMGGYAALSFAEKYTDFLQGLCLFHSHAMPDTPEAKINRERAINAVSLNRKGFINQFISELFAPENLEKLKEYIEDQKEKARQIPKETIIAAQSGMKERSGKINLLTEISVPILFIVGKKDSRIPIDKILVQTILPTHSEVLILGKVGHMGFIEATEETMKTLDCFVNKTFS